MTSLLSSATSVLAEAVRALKGLPATYHRGAESVALTAAMGQSVWAAVDAEGTAVEQRSVDFLVLASELVLVGTATEPRRDDRIKVAVGTKTRVYQVVPGGEDERPWRYTDESEQQIRIHTVHVKDE